MFDQFKQKIQKYQQDKNEVQIFKQKWKKLYNNILNIWDDKNPFEFKLNPDKSLSINLKQKDSKKKNLLEQKLKLINFKSSFFEI